jgi:hypothetical protein
MKNQTKQITNYLAVISILLLFAQSCSSSREGALAVEAGIVMNAGNVTPIARTEFYLLDDSLENILEKAKIPPLSGGERFTPLQNFIVLEQAKRELGNEMTDEGKRIRLQTDNAIKSHIVATMTTDFSGKAVFDNVKAGKYYLMGVGGTGKQAIVWNLAIEIKTGKQSVTLDNKNAALIL